ncbi:MAG: hypothetical protein ACLP3R_23010 [Candidatus Korobacteraceae bacterium]
MRPPTFNVTEAAPSEARKRTDPDSSNVEGGTGRRMFIVSLQPFDDDSAIPATAVIVKEIITESD